ncbi:MAG: winged helix-turn-helix domain-containing protein [Nitrosopumilus sp.]
MGDRRGRLEIYHDILSAIREDSQNNEKISPTRVQFKSNLSYGKLKEFVSSMVEKKILKDEMTMKITDSGTKFYDEYAEIREMITKLCNDVFRED